MSAHSRKLNMIQAAQDGITLARDELRGPGGHAQMMRVLCNEFPWDEEDNRPMTVARAAYLAAYFLAWKDAGCPPLN